MKPLLGMLAIVGASVCMSSLASEPHHVVIDFKAERITLDSPEITVKNVEDISTCVDWEWTQGRLTNDQALVLLSRLTAADKARMPGRPFSFHGDSWLPYGHWSENVSLLLHVISASTGDMSHRNEIEQQFVDAGLAVTKDGYIHYNRWPLSRKLQQNLVSLLAEIERKWADSPQFQGHQTNPPYPSSEQCGLKLLNY